MRTALARTLHRLASWLAPKSFFSQFPEEAWTTITTPTSNTGRHEPTGAELLAELRNTAYTCATLNAAACAAFPPRLYAITEGEGTGPKYLTRGLTRGERERLLRGEREAASGIVEVLDHPLLDLFRQVNPAHSGFDLWEFTTLYQEVHGSAYWLLDIGPLGTPTAIWILPSQQVTPRRGESSKPGARIVDYYEYRVGGAVRRFSPDEIIHFRYPDPRDPYTSGLSPLRAAFENVALAADYLAFKLARVCNRAIPDAIVSPDDTISAAEMARLEQQWNQKFRQGGAGRVVVAENGMKVQLLNQSLGDLAALADVKAVKEDIANAFHVPLAFLTSDTNLANLQAAEHQHLARAVAPRLKRRDEKINEQLIPLFDPSGRLFVASDDPVPANAADRRQQQELDLKYGVMTVNEVRAERGLPPVEWGDVPVRVRA